MKKSLSLRISFITICMILVCATCTGIISYAFYRSDSIEANAQRALDIARSAATMVDGDEMRAIMATLEENDYFHALKAILDEISTSTGAQFLYVLDREYDTQVTYFVEGYNHNGGEEPTGLGDRETTKYYNALTFTALDTGTEQMTGIYDSDGYGAMVSGLVPIFDSAGVVVGVLGVDLGVDDVLASSQVFALRSVIVVVVLCALLGAVSFQVITRMVGRPVRTLTAVASAVAMGDTDVKVDITSQDELGDLAAAFRSIVENSREQARVMEALARGDLTQRPIVRNEKDAINRAIAGTLSNLNAMFGDVRNMAAGVSSGSAQMAQGAQALASGSTQQAAAIQQLSASTQDILRQAEDSARQARDAYEDTRQAGALMDESIGSMTRMTEAMAGISAASQAISQVISVIDGIAFQTSILSLNASVEAARAGQHGRGFAVVAEEVRSLAAKSAQAAQETAALIQNSIRRVQEGSDIARDTSKSLEAVAQLAGRNAAAMHAINETSQQQTTAIAEINKGIEQISMVVQQSSATAQESAASSHEMDAQAQQLTDMVSRFKLDTPDALPPTVGGYLNAPGGRF